MELNNHFRHTPKSQSLEKLQTPVAPPVKKWRYCTQSCLRVTKRPIYSQEYRWATIDKSIGGPPEKRCRLDNTNLIVRVILEKLIRG